MKKWLVVLLIGMFMLSGVAQARFDYGSSSGGSSSGRGSSIFSRFFRWISGFVPGYPSGGGSSGFGGANKRSNIVQKSPENAQGSLDHKTRLVTEGTPCDTSADCDTGTTGLICCAEDNKCHKTCGDSGHQNCENGFIYDEQTDQCVCPVATHYVWNGKCYKIGQAGQQEKAATTSGGNAPASCRVAAASGVKVAAGYVNATLAWTPGQADSQAVYVDADTAKVGANCLHGCAVSRSLSGAANRVALAGLKPGTTYHFRIVSKKSCGSKWAEGTFTTKPAVAIESASFVNNQKQGRQGVPAAVECFVNHDEDNAVRAMHARRLGLKSSGSKRWVEFLPNLSAGRHVFECSVDTSVAPAEQGKESASVEYTIHAPAVNLTVSNSTVGSRSAIIADVSSDFYLNETDVYVDGVLLYREDLRGKKQFSAHLRWDAKLPPGSHDIRVVAVDYVGNRGEAVSSAGIADGAVSCSIAPYELSSSSDFSITCYDTKGNEADCPEMSVSLSDPKAGTVSGTHFTMNSGYSGLSSLVASAKGFSCRAAVEGQAPENGTAPSAGAPGASANGVPLRLCVSQTPDCADYAEKKSTDDTDGHRAKHQ